MCVCWCSNRCHHAIADQPLIYNDNDNNILVALPGADDATLKVWDERVGFETPALCLPQGRPHEAGVCIVAPSPHDDHSILTGSYDEAVRLFDARALRRRPTAEVRPGGGVWRLKWHPERDGLVAAACMYEGFNLISCEGGALAVAQHFAGPHESIAYGVDWHASGRTLAACSFYDKQVSLWDVDGVA